MRAKGYDVTFVKAETKTCGVELAPKGIRTNAILPGTIFSEMMLREGEFTEFTISKIPMGRGGEPREIG